MLQVLRTFIKNGFTVTEYSRDGVNIHATTSVPVLVGPVPEIPTVAETVEDRLIRMEARIEEGSIMQVDILMTIFEQLMMKEGV